MKTAWTKNNKNISTRDMAKKNTLELTMLISSIAKLSEENASELNIATGEPLELFMLAEVGKIRIDTDRE